MRSRTKKFLLVVLLLSLGPIAAQADPITFNLTTDLEAPSDSTLFFEGFITFDSTDVFAGNTVYSSSFLDWGFTWGTDLAVSPGTPGAGWVLGYDSITFDALAEITTWSICVSTPNDCLYSSNPGFFSDSNGNLNNTYAGGSTNYGVEQTWTKVPEPGTLALLGLGLIAIAARRSRKT